MSEQQKPNNLVCIKSLKNDKAHQARDRQNSEVGADDSGRPAVPTYLSIPAQKIFSDLLDNISEFYEPCKADIEAYVMFANNKEQMEYYERYLKENGSTYTYGLSDREGIRPEYKMYDDCKKLHLRLLGEFYLTKASRKGVTFKEKAKAVVNPFAALG